MIVIMGKGGAGKDTVSKSLQKNHGIKRVVTYTTRRMRPGEKDGVDYNFIPENEFVEKEKAGFFAETSKTGGCMYGSPASAFREKNALIVLDPMGVRQAAKKINTSDLFVFLLDADKDLLRKRMLQRGDLPEKVEERLTEDDNRFKDAESLCGFIIRQNEMTNADEIAHYIACITRTEIVNYPPLRR